MANRKPNEPDLKGLLSQMEKVQEEMARARDELAEETMQISTGNGAVSVEITGHQRLNSIKIDAELLDPTRRDELEALLLKVINQAIEMSQTMAAQRMQGLMGGINLPGL